MMTQEGLNFEIVTKIEDKLSPHIASLKTIGTLIAIASDDGEMIEEDIAFGLSTFIDEWIETYNNKIRDAIEEVKESPGYILHRANELIHWIRRGAPTEVDKIKEIIEQLESVIKTYGSVFRSEAEPLLEELKKIREKELKQ
jgi:hypothetical protein